MIDGDRLQPGTNQQIGYFLDSFFLKRYSARALAHGDSCFVLDDPAVWRDA
jgi:hypothetical protein